MAILQINLQIQGDSMEPFFSVWLWSDWLNLFDVFHPITIVIF